MDKITYNFKIEMSKEDAEYFEDFVHSVSIYYAGRGKIKYCFREIKQSDKIDREMLELMRERRDYANIAGVETSRGAKRLELNEVWR